jgi:RND family efflux transporter MFP subunit
MNNKENMKESFWARTKIRSSKFKQYAFSHKKMSIIAAIVLILIIYWLVKVIFPATVTTTYAIAEVQNGSITTNVTGSGQVSASNQIELKTKASGDILKVNVITGQEVKAGAKIAQIDNPSAYLDYRSAQIAYEKFVQPADDSTRIQAENDLNNAKQSVEKAGDNLNNAYDSGYNSIASTYLDLTDTMSGAYDMLYSGTGFLSDQSIISMPSETKMTKNRVGVSFDKIKNQYTDALAVYRSSARSDSADSIDKLMKSTYDVTKEFSTVLKDMKNLVDHIKTLDANPLSGNSSAAANTAANNLTSWIGKINSDLSSLSNAMNNTEDLKNTVKNGPQTLAQKQAAYDKVIEGADSLDVESQRINLQQKALTYQNLFITAPFDGVIAKISVKPSDSVSSGASIGTIITKNKVADITVNEVDAAKIVAGQKATLTFDAVDGLEITGVVQSIDLVGTVSQGVVNYNVKITFDVQDERVKSGMSVSASIITNNKQNIIVVPNSAIKSNGGVKYVELFSSSIATTSITVAVNEIPVKQQVETGLSNDTETEIVSGLIVGDRIATKTSKSNAVTTAPKAASPSLFGGGGTRSMGR